MGGIYAKRRIYSKWQLDFVYSAMDVLRGILIPSFVDSDDPLARRRWDRAAVGLRRMPEPSLTAWLDSAAVRL